MMSPRLRRSVSMAVSMGLEEGRSQLYKGFKGPQRNPSVSYSSHHTHLNTPVLYSDPASIMNMKTAMITAFLLVLGVSATPQPDKVTITEDDNTYVGIDKVRPFFPDIQVQQ